MSIGREHVPWRDLPKPVSREKILDMIGPDGADKWRNPVVVETAKASWPSPQDDNTRERARQSGTQDKEMAVKGPLK